MTFGKTGLRGHNPLTTSPCEHPFKGRYPSHPRSCGSEYKSTAAAPLPTWCAALHVCCIACVLHCISVLHCRRACKACAMKQRAEAHKRGADCGGRRRGLGRCWRVKGRAKSIRVDGRCGEGRPARRGSARVLAVLASRPLPRSSRAKSSHEGWARGSRGETAWRRVVRRASRGWCGARGAVRSGCARAVVQEDGRRSEGSGNDMQGGGGAGAA